MKNTMLVVVDERLHNIFQNRPPGCISERSSFAVIVRSYVVNDFHVVSRS